MSRGFVKEEDQEEVPMVPPRADLPPGVVNYVTPEGMKLLEKEKEELLTEKETNKHENEKEQRIHRNYVNVKLRLLEERISSAKVIRPEEQPKNEVRFGATISIKTVDSGKIQTYRIVGVDEADISKGKVSFISPIARIIMGKKTGDTVQLKLPKENKELEVIEIKYQ